LQLNGSVPLFTGLQQVYNVQRTRYDLLASQYDYETARNNIALNVASAYLQILLNKEIVKVAEQQKSFSETQKLTVQQRISAGALPETAIYDIESQLGRDEVNIVNAKNSVDLSMLALEQLLQLKEDPTFDIGSPDVKADNMADIASLSSPVIYEYALNNQPVIKGADARVKSADYARKISYGGFSPTISAFGSLSTSYFSQDKKILGYSDTTINEPFMFGGINGNLPITIPGNVQYGNYSFFGDMQNNFRQVVGLTIDIPLFSRGEKFINVQKAKLQLELRQVQLDASKNQLRQDIEQAYANAKAAAESYMANQKSLEAAQKAYSSTETRYQAGAASDYDMQQVKNNLLSAQSDMLRAKYTYVFRMKILDFYQGKPITLN
jgi:outer membrane protein